MCLWEGTISSHKSGVEKNTPINWTDGCVYTHATAETNRLRCFQQNCSHYRAIQRELSCAGHASDADVLVQTDKFRIMSCNSQRKKLKTRQGTPITDQLPHRQCIQSERITFDQLLNHPQTAQPPVWPTALNTSAPPSADVPLHIHFIASTART